MEYTQIRYEVDRGIGLATLCRPEQLNAFTPVISAINGHAVGIGITMTLPMDIRIAAEDAKIGFVFVRRRIVPGASSTWFLPHIVGVGKAAELM